MSIKYMSWVWEHSPHKGSALLLLLAIADMANDDGVSWPGLAKLSEKTRLGRRYVIDLIAELEKAGAIEVLHRKNGELNLSNIYRVVCDTSLVNPSSSGSEPQTTTPSEPQDTRVVNPSSPKSSIKHHKETSINHHSSGAKKPAPERDPLLDHPAVQEYKRISKINLAVALREEVASTVTNTQLWGTIVYDWIGYGWNRQNVKGMLEAYRAGGIQRKNGNGHNPQSKMDAAEAAFAAIAERNKRNGK